MLKKEGLLTQEQRKEEEMTLFFLSAPARNSVLFPCSLNPETCNLGPATSPRLLRRAGRGGIAVWI